MSDDDSTALGKHSGGLFRVTLISFFDSFARLLAPATIQVFKMVSQLNSYCKIIDIKTKEGQAALANAIEKFGSPLVGDNRLLLVGSLFQKLKDNILQLGSYYRYDYLIKKVATRQTVDPTTFNVSVDLHMNMIERYLDDNVELAKKHASLTWGDHSFTVMSMNTITELTQAKSFLDATGDLTNASKEIVLEQMHSKSWDIIFLSFSAILHIRQTNKTVIFTCGLLWMELTKKLMV